MKTQLISLASKISDISYQNSTLFFCGQSGFVFKNKAGILVAVDLYLSDCCERYYGYKRLMPQILGPCDIVFDYVVATHAHEDHFDDDAIPYLLDNEKTKLIVAYDCQSKVEQMGIPTNKVTYLKVGDEINAGGIGVRAVFCDHGIETPHAIGLVIDMDGKRVCIAGDTKLRLDCISDITDYGPFDVLICPINGAFGNMGEVDAVTFCEYVKPHCMIPCHYWNFAEHRGDPYLFAEEIKRKLPQQIYRIMSMGECMEF